MSFSNTPHSYTPTAGMAEMLASANMREKSKQQQQQGKFSSGGFRDQTNTKLAQGSQSSFSSKTPSTAKKGAAPSKEQTEDGVVDEGDFRSGVAGADGDVKKKRTRPKIDADLLAGDNGFAAVLKTFPTLKHELKGEGHEAHDVRLLISRLQMWAWKMAPAVSFHDAVATLEKLGHTVRVQAFLRHMRSVTGGGAVDVGDMSNIQVQPKRKKGSAVAEGDDNEVESTLIYEEQPAAARGDGGSGFYYDEGDDYAEYETSAYLATAEHAAMPAVVPAPAAPVQVTEDMRLRIEANKRAAEARRAAKAAAAAAELTSLGGGAGEGQEESAELQQTHHQPQQGEQELEQQEQQQPGSVDQGSPSEDVLLLPISLSGPLLEDEQRLLRTEVDNSSDIDEDSARRNSLDEEQQPRSCSTLSRDTEMPGSDSAETAQVLAAQEQEGGDNQSYDEQMASSERGEAGSVFAKPLRSIVIGCSDEVFASLTKRIIKERLMTMGFSEEQIASGKSEWSLILEQLVLEEAPRHVGSDA